MRVAPLLVSAPANLAMLGRKSISISKVLLLGFVALTGCREQAAIRHYQVSRIKSEPPAPTAAAFANHNIPAKPQRMIASIMPVGQQAWFVKGTGEPAAVAAQVEAWETFLKSWKISDSSSPPTWELPTQWVARATAGPMRFATFDAPGVEFSVTVLPINGKTWDEYLEANVNRWRGQLQLAEATLDEIKSQVRKLQVGSYEVTLVDLEGKTTGQSSMGPMANTTTPAVGTDDPHAGLPGFDRSQQPNSESVSPAGNSSAAGFEFDVPTGWQTGKSGPFRIAAFDIQANGKKAEVTLSALGAKSGTLLENVNRWRTQLGLSAVDDAKLASLLSTVPIGDQSGQFVDLAQEEGEQAMFAVVLPMEDRTIFAKIMGDKALVVEQRGPFEQFVKSLRPTTP